MAANEDNKTATMNLDASAIEGLHVFNADDARPKAERTKASIFDVLNYTQTCGGRLTLEKWLRRPLVEKEAIEMRLNMVEAFIKNKLQRKALHENSLKKIPDFKKILTKFESENKAALEDLYKGGHNTYCKSNT